MSPILLALAVTLAAAAPSAAPITGTILDPSGAPVPDARVRLEAAGAAVAEVRTGGDGRFQFAIEPSGRLQIVVTAAGFAPATAAVSADSGPVQITLRPAAFFEEVNVTSSRADLPRTDPTATMTVISSSDLATSAPLTLDDALKMVPGFTLFRRTSSRTANPTTQGVALRGIGGTAQSRSLVLADGLPLNDAFGGWVYWSKVPQAAIDRVEVQRGSGSDLYGADAVGGVVQLLTLRPTRPAGRALLEAGTLGTGRVSLFGGSRARGWRYSAGGEWFTIDGYIPIATEQDPGIAPRGPIDGKLGSTHRSGARVGGISGGRRLARRRRRQRVRRTSAERDADLDQQHRVAATLGRAGRRGGRRPAQACAASAGRSSTGRCSPPSTPRAPRKHSLAIRMSPRASFGLAGQWFRAWGRHGMLVGAEGRHVEGTSIEVPYTQGRPQAATEAGGTQRLGSAFVQDTVRVNDRDDPGDRRARRRLAIDVAHHRVRQILGILQSARVRVVPGRRERHHRSGRRLSRIPGADAQRVLPEFRVRKHADQAE